MCYCNRSVQICIWLNTKSEQALSSPDIKPLNLHEDTFEEAVQVLKKSHEAGLEHIVYVKNKETKTDDIDFLCNCLQLLLQRAWLGP